MRSTILAAGLLVLAATSVSGGIVYEVTATDGKDKITYRVKFGSARNYKLWTAFDPSTKAFVYLMWKDQKPEPAAVIWDHRTGETVKLYKFQGVETPLPIIPSIKDLKVCPQTGDKEFTSKPVGYQD
jgi:hypothetical protein